MMQLTIQTPVFLGVVAKQLLVYAKAVGTSNAKKMWDKFKDVKENAIDEMEKIGEDGLDAYYSKHGKLEAKADVGYWVNCVISYTKREITNIKSEIKGESDPDVIKDYNGRITEYNKVISESIRLYFKALKMNKLESIQDAEKTVREKKRSIKGNLS
jgi:hypothetical protein